jgi:F-type H+-transporting ATPase subunit delta
LKSASLQYAKALADVALGEKAVAPTVKQLTAFGDLLAESAELRNFLASPAVSREAKHGVLEKLVARLRGSKILRNFLFVVIDKRRTHILPEIIAAFQEVIRRREGILEAQVLSATELSAAQKAELARTLERRTGKRIEAKYSVDAALLGGAVVTLGDTVYDGSIRSRLNELRARLTGE